jgi:hypothetical protein
LATLVLALQQETAEDAFKKVESAIEKARSIKVVFTIDSGNVVTIPGKGSLSIDENGRAKLEGTLRSKDGAAIALTEECDGKRIVSSFDKHQVEAHYDAKNGRSNYNVYLSRIGVLLGQVAMHGFYTRASQSKAPYTLDLQQLFQVKNVKFAESRKGMTGLTYELKSAIEPMPVDLVKVWYDPNNYKIARREYRIQTKAFDETIIEDYIDVQFDDGKVATPKDKPAPAAPVSDAEMDNLFFRSKLTVAEAHLKAGRKAQAAEILEEVIKTYPKHPNIPDARRLLDEAKKK